MVKHSQVKSCLNLKSIYLGDSMLKYPIMYVLRGQIHTEQMTPLTTFFGGAMKQTTRANVKGEDVRRTPPINIHLSGAVNQNTIAEVKGT